MQLPGVVTEGCGGDAGHGVPKAGTPLTDVAFCNPTEKSKPRRCDLLTRVARGSIRDKNVTPR